MASDLGSLNGSVSTASTVWILPQVCGERFPMSNGCFGSCRGTEVRHGWTTRQGCGKEASRNTRLYRGLNRPALVSPLTGWRPPALGATGRNPNEHAARVCGRANRDWGKEHADKFCLGSIVICFS